MILLSHQSGSVDVAEQNKTSELSLHPVQCNSGGLFSCPTLYAGNRRIFPSNCNLLERVRGKVKAPFYSGGLLVIIHLGTSDSGWNPPGRGASAPIPGNSTVRSSRRQSCHARRRASASARGNPGPPQKSASAAATSPAREKKDVSRSGRVNLYADEAETAVAQAVNRFFFELFSSSGSFCLPKLKQD